MKTNLLKSIFISLILVLGVSNACGYNEYNKQYLYFDGSEFTSFFSDNCTPYISPKWDYNCSDGNYNGGDKQMTSITSKKYYYLDLSKSSSSYKSFRGFYIGRSASFYNGASMGVVDGSTSNCIKATGWGTYKWTNFAPPMSSASIENKSTVYGGDGTSNNPYQIKKGATISVQASATSSVPNDPQTKYYRFYKKENSGTRSAIGNESTTTTSSFTASSTVGTKYAVDVEARNEYYGTYGEKATSSTLYFITIEPIYAILGSFNDWTHSANTWDLSEQGSNNWKATFHLNKGSHTFKVVHNSSYYGKNNTTITRTSATASSLSTSGADINLTTDVAGNYTFTFNSSTKALTVTYPEAYTFTYGIGTNSNGLGTVAVTPNITNGTLVAANTEIALTATPKLGYKFVGWYSEAACTNQVSTANPYNFQINSTTTLYAKFVERDLIVNADWGWYESMDKDQKVYTYTKSNLASGLHSFKFLESDHTVAYDYDDVQKPTGTYANGGLEVTALRPGHANNNIAFTLDRKSDVTITLTLVEDNKPTVHIKAIPYYNITLEQTGCAQEGTPTTEVKWGSDMPEIELPVAPIGYIFGGYYTEQNGLGTQYYNADGTSAKKWDIDTKEEIIILYAKWEKRRIILNHHFFWDYDWQQWEMTQDEHNPAVYTSFAEKVIIKEDDGTAPFDGGHHFNFHNFNQGNNYNEQTLAYTYNDVQQPTGSGYLTDANIHKTRDENPTIQFDLDRMSDITITLTLKSAIEDQDKQNTWPTVNIHAVPRYTLTYDLNYDAQPNRIYYIYHLLSGNNIEIAEGTPTRPGYTFVKWTSASDGTGVEPDGTQPMGEQDRTYYAQWTPATYTVTLDNEGGSGVESVQATYGSAMPAITIPTKDDHLFMGYYDGDNGTGTQYHNSDGTSAKNWDKTDNTTLHAKWIPYSQCIFFKNNLKWNNVYVYTFSDEMWHNGDNNEDPKDDKGVQPKVNRIEYGKMKQIEKTDIYYYILTNLTGFSHIAFSEKDMHDYEYFYDSKAIYRGDRSDQMPLFIPEKDQTPSTTNQTQYYSSGLWMKYNSTESGYNWRSDKNNWDANANHFTASAKGGYSFTALVTLTGRTDYEFKTAGLDGSWFGYNGTLDQTKCKDLHFKASESNNAKVHPTVTGDYLFTIYLGDGKMMVTLDYPLGIGDFRLVYKDNTNGAHDSHYIKKKEEGSNDTISFFIHHNKEPQIIVQKCTNVTNDGVVTWTDVAIGDVNPAASITESGVYNFVLQQIEGQETPILVAQAHPYTGNYYIRTDAAAGGWDSFRQAGNKMTYSSYASKHTHFNHYFCSWINEGRNVKYTIANDYSLCISDTLDGDAIIGNTGEHVGYLPADANVRFGWNSTNNELERAYIAGSGVVSDRFLVLIGDEKLTDLEDKPFNISGLNENEAIFADKGNWIYQLDAKAGKGAPIQLIATYNENEQTFFNTSSVALMEEGNNDTYPVRFIYDFKTNNLMAAWLLLEEENDVQGDSDLNANMMIIRKHHEQAQQINLNADLTAVGTAYGVMTFDKYFLNNRDKNGNVLADERSIYERALYWISFPFDVRIRDVFGFGEYMDTWIMEYYDGEARAKNGAWVDSESYWTYITDLDYVLKKGVGYVLCLDLDKMAYNASMWNNTDEVSLYFPSAQPIGTINTEQAESVIVPAHECTIIRPTPYGNRTIADANWNVIGVPCFINLNINLPEYNTTTAGTINQDDVLYYYSYNQANNTYTVAASGQSVFQTMQAYMVQYAGEINWWTMRTWTSQQIAARRNANAGPEELNFRLELAQGDKALDQTFIQQQQEGATADFDMNKDLTKIINAGANIYTLVAEGNVLAAGNVLPMGEAIIPVGVNVDQEMEYTFRMPDGTEGITVELVDYETNTRTNLLVSDYTTTLEAGACDTRFALHIQPRKVATSIENSTSEGVNGSEVQKYLIDGRLYLKKDGILYDAQGHRL